MNFHYPRVILLFARLFFFSGQAFSQVTAAFTVVDAEDCPPLLANFQDQSSGGVTSYSWDFGDGGTSTQQNPSHNYAAAGFYTVTLTVSNGTATDTEVKTN